jgi:multiple sugar transport system ATP-binding protein
MAGIALSGVSKRFGAVEVIRDVSLDIKPGELVVFLGPSGSGKTTLLRMIAGLESIDKGTLTIDGVRSENLAPGKRNVAMVFQNYALYPHMTVAENMAFGLRNIRVAPVVIRQRIAEAARMLEMEPLLNRRPSQLSGGQRQRVAIGRAIVKEPKAFLFDEPLSNLDAALRARTRVELAELHQRLKSTMIYVTHDQVEAMTLADRIVILKGGEIEQVGTPDEVYNNPASVFVGGFIGSPAMNFARGTIRGGAVVFDGGSSVPLQSHAIGRAGSQDGRDVIVGIRPEHFVPAGEGHALSGRVQVVEPLGSDTLIHFALGPSTLTARVAPDMRPSPGETLSIGVDPSRVHLFDAATERALV